MSTASLRIFHPAGGPLGRLQPPVNPPKNRVAGYRDSADSLSSPITKKGTRQQRKGGNNGIWNEPSGFTQIFSNLKPRGGESMDTEVNWCHIFLFVSGRKFSHWLNPFPQDLANFFSQHAIRNSFSDFSALLRAPTARGEPESTANSETMVAFLIHKCQGCQKKASSKKFFHNCQCDLAYYCSAECQRIDWLKHRKMGKHCANCRKGGPNLPPGYVVCSCKTVIYCSEECKNAHWCFHSRGHVSASLSVVWNWSDWLFLLFNTPSMT